MRDSLLRRTNKNDGSDFSLKLEAVKEEEELPSGRMNKHHTELHMKKSMIRNRAIIKKQHLLT